MIAFRFSLSIVVFFILAVFHVALPLCFALTAACEVLVVGTLVYLLYKEEYTPNNLWFDILAIQYVEHDEINLTDMINTCGARVLALLLGFCAVWLYIPTITIYLLTLVDVIKK